MAGSQIAPLAIRVNGRPITRLFRPGEEAPSDYLNVPPDRLAEWFISNWWRLRWEPLPVRAATIEELDPSWRLAHDFRSIGSEYAWPRAIVWGQDTRVGIQAEPAPDGVVGPVRFVANVSEFIPAQDFEHDLDSFLQSVASNSERLSVPLGQLMAERNDPEVAAWRRLEARLGFDPDDVPQPIMGVFARFSGHFGQADVEEAASARPGQAAGDVLQATVDRAKTSAAFVCKFDAMASSEPVLAGVDEFPWQRGERIASHVRDRIGKQGPLADTDLADLLNTSQRAFEDSASAGPAYAVRLAMSGVERVLPRSKYRSGRRFEFARAMGDALAYGHFRPDSLGPIARSMTERQQFQRSFAQNLLCPFSELMAFVNHDKPDEEDIEAASQHFGVSQRVVQTTLVNHRVISVPEFQALAEAS